MSNNLGELYEEEAIREFGAALRRALRTESVKDFASLTEIDRANSKNDLAEAIKTFLRRYESAASKRHWTRPEVKHLEQLMKFTDKYDLDVVKAALISHALTKKS